MVYLIIFAVVLYSCFQNMENKFLTFVFMNFDNAIVAVNHLQLWNILRCVVGCFEIIGADVTRALGGRQREGRWRHTTQRGYATKSPPPPPRSLLLCKLKPGLFLTPPYRNSSPSTFEPRRKSPKTMASLFQFGFLFLSVPGGKICVFGGDSEDLTAWHERAPFISRYDIDM